jgi:hypothetical protein
MSDEVDQANDMMEVQISRAVAKAAGIEIPTNDTGLCWYCHEPVTDTRRWCCADCRELWEAKNK